MTDKQIVALFVFGLVAVLIIIYQMYINAKAFEETKLKIQKQTEENKEKSSVIVTMVKSGATIDEINSVIYYLSNPNAVNPNLSPEEKRLQLLKEIGGKRAKLLEYLVSDTDNSAKDNENLIKACYDDEDFKKAVEEAKS